MEKYDTIIVGGGSLGMAIAYRLSATVSQAKIAVVEYSEGFAASRAAGAMLGCFGEVTKYTFSNTAHEEKFNLMYASHKLWPRWRKELEKVTKEKIWYRAGTYIILNQKAGTLDEENFNAIIGALKKYKEPYKKILPKDIVGLNPTAHAKTLKAIYLEEGAIDGPQYLKVLKDACIKKGVTFIEGQVERIARKSNEYTLIGNFKSIASEKLILATGSYTNSLLKKSQLPVTLMPVLAGVGFAMVTRKTKKSLAKHVIRTANWSGSCGLHLIPLDSNRQYIGATNVVFGTPKSMATVGMIHAMSNWAMEQLDTDLYSSWVEQCKVGNRPVSLDTFPLIGQTTSKGLFIVTGTYRDGLYCSPVIAQSIVNEIVGKKRLISELFLPERSLIQTSKQQETITASAEHALLNFHQNEAAFSDKKEDTVLRKVYVEKAKKIYKRFGTKIAINPDILSFLITSVTEKVELDEISKYLAKQA